MKHQLLQQLQVVAQQVNSQFGAYQPMQYGMQQQFLQFQQQQHQPQVQEKEMATMEVDPEAFAHQFDQLERELAHEETEAFDNEYEKEQFADAARQVQKSMITEKNLKSEETTSKFEQSNFLKLMALISDRKVEISREGDKLVEKSSGEDIRKHLSDPLRHEKPDYHDPVHETTHFDPQPTLHQPQRTNESANVMSHLPDPLAHIKNGALDENLSPLQAARIISGGQVTGNDWMEDEAWLAPIQPAQPRGRAPGILDKHWQEVYDDYRNDDDFH